MNVIRSLIIAFSMYTVIPMPRVAWNEKSMRYALCFFPFTGLLIGGLMWGWYALCIYLNINYVLRGIGLALIPVFLTGGIHLDGYMDTQDALNSRQDKEKMLAIMKEPHVGAFAVIRLVSYMLLAVGLFTALRRYDPLLIICGLMFSRSLSALGLLTLPSAKEEGLGAGFAAAAGKNSKEKRSVTMVVTLLVILSGLTMCLFGAGGQLSCAAGLGMFLYYRHMSVKRFGGVTGDLAGYFLCMAELWMLLAYFAGGYFL